MFIRRGRAIEPDPPNLTGEGHWPEHCGRFAARITKVANAGDHCGVCDVAVVDTDIRTVREAHRVFDVARLQCRSVEARSAEVQDLAGVENGFPGGATIHAPAFVRG